MERVSIPRPARRPPGVRIATRRQPRALDGSLTGLRFCATEWHVVRIKCASCASTESIAYFEIEGADGLVKAETPTNAGTYSKIIFAKKYADPEIFADDLATLALHVLVGEAGWWRSAPNPFLLRGAADRCPLI